MRNTILAYPPSICIDCSISTLLPSPKLAASIQKTAKRTCLLATLNLAVEGGLARLGALGSEFTVDCLGLVADELLELLLGSLEGDADLDVLDDNAHLVVLVAGALAAVLGALDV